MRALPTRSITVIAVLVCGTAAAQTTDTDPNAVPTLPPPAPAVPGAPAARIQPPPFPLPQRAPSASQPAGPGIAPGLREPNLPDDRNVPTGPNGVQDKLGSPRP